MGFQVEAAALISKLEKLNNIDLSPALTEACLLIENAAKEKAPVASGELRRSITHTVEEDYGEVGTNLFYAPYVEYGTGIFSSQGNGRQDVPWVYRDAAGNWHSTSGRKPRPFLIPAYEENKGNITQIFEKYIKEELG